MNRIVIQPNKYCIHIASKKITGLNWGIGGFGLGYISSDTYEIEVCKTEHSTDYAILSEWIENE